MQEILMAFGTLNVQNRAFYRSLVVFPGMSLLDFAAANRIPRPLTNSGYEVGWVTRMYENAMRLARQGLLDPALRPEEV
jgi:hypothetical protein